MTDRTGTSNSPKRKQKPACLFHLVTNHQNMLYILAAGMVMSPAGFRGKHYTDALSKHPGRIPLFRDGKIPAAALAHAVSERKHLLPCIASFDLSAVSGKIAKLRHNGTGGIITLPKANNSRDEFALLMPAPLPLNLLCRISFSSSEDKQVFETSASDFSNVDISSCHLEVSEMLFSAAIETAWPEVPPQGQLLKEGSDTDPAYGKAFGGLLAMLYHLANRSDTGLAVFRLASGGEDEKDNELIQSDPMLASFSDWLAGREISADADVRARLFWGVTESLITAGEQQKPPLDMTLAYLEAELDLLKESEFHPRLEKLIEDMRASLGLGDGTVTELFERHKGPLSRSLLLLCLRKHCTDLLEFSHSLLSDLDYILAAILFGVRDSWLQLPKELRSPELSAWVAANMAAADLQKQGSSLKMNMPPRPKPLRELFADAPDGWSDSKQKTAIELAAECSWYDCIQTAITGVDGRLPPYVEKDPQLILTGRVKVTEKIDKEKFLQRLGTWPPVDAAVESRVRRELHAIHDELNNPSCE